MEHKEEHEHHAEHHEHHSSHGHKEHESHSAKHAKQGFLGSNPLLSLVIIGVVCLAVGGAVGFFIPHGTPGAVNTGGTNNTANAGFVPLATVSEKVKTYVNENFLKTSGMESKIVNSKDFSPYLYEISLDLYKGTTKSSNAVVLATKDGKNLILSSNVVFDLDTPVPATGTSGGTTQTESLKCSDIAKVSSDKAMLEAFVVSYCPFGLQAQRALAPVAKLLPNNVKIRYIGSVENGTITAMHGDKEAKENLRQICLREEQPGKYWPYVECFIKADGKGDACLAEANVDKAKLDACTASTGNGLKYAQVDFGIATKLGIGGSPSLVLNGTQVSEFAFATGQGLTSDAARSADNLKNLVCCSMDKAAAVCSTALDKAGAATSFSTTYSAAGGSATTAGSGCGT